MDSSSRKHTLSAAGVLVAMGIIYGDIGTSPIYPLRFIVGKNPVTEDLILGGLSLVFWTLTIITTVKYVYLALSADNKGEGGIFALYALVRKYRAGWVIFPAPWVGRATARKHSPPVPIGAGGDSLPACRGVSSCAGR